MHPHGGLLLGHLPDTPGPHRAATAVRATPALPAIQLTDKALSHLRRLQTEKGSNLLLRMGVKNGGCSGMS